MEIRVRQLENRDIDSRGTPDELNNLIDENIGEGISDYREREARKCNIIIDNLPE